MFIIQTHKDIMTDAHYDDCEEAHQYRYPVSLKHLEYLRKLSYLTTLENGLVTHVQALTAVDDVIYIYVDKVSLQTMSELRMVLRPHVLAGPGKFKVICKPEGRDLSVPAEYYGFTIPKEKQDLATLAALIGEDSAKRQLDVIATLVEGKQELVMQWTANEEMAHHFVVNGLQFVSVQYAL